MGKGRRTDCLVGVFCGALDLVWKCMLYVPIVCRERASLYACCCSSGLVDSACLGRSSLDQFSLWDALGELEG